MMAKTTESNYTAAAATASKDVIGVPMGAMSVPSSSSSPSSCRHTTASKQQQCCGFTRLALKLKKLSKMLRPNNSRQSSFQCLYDPLSYSLNFDSSGSMVDLDEEYYRFYAFTSRFVANSRIPCSTSRPVAVSH